MRRILKKSLRTLQGSNDEEKGDATHKKGDWHSKKTTVETEIAAPNISLNLSARVGPWEMSAAGVVGLIVQTGVLVFAGLLTYLPGLNTTVGDPSVARYAFRKPSCVTYSWLRPQVTEERHSSERPGNIFIGRWNVYLRICD